jgi:LPXTG-motif cell wall-anchored protein
MMEKKDKYTVSLSGYGYRISNTPLSTETSLKVTKGWSHPANDATLYEKEQITVRLLANGVDTGRAEIVSLKNGWQITFHGLPYLDAEGVPIRYTVVEIMESKDWIPVYGEITVISNNGGNPTYETTVTNHYRWTNAVELPSTGGIGYPLYILIGLILISAPFVYGFILRRRHERRTRQ